MNNAQPRDDVETRLAVVEAILNEHGGRLDRLEAKIDRIIYIGIGFGSAILVTTIGALVASIAG